MKMSGREINEPSPNPLDVVEDVAGVRQWPFERTNDEELVVEVAGEWCDYRLFFSWRDDVQALHFACVYDMRVPSNRRVEVTALLAQMNEKMSIGHFEVWSDDGMPLYRHALLQRGAPGLSAEQLEESGSNSAGRVRTVLSRLPVRHPGRQERGRGDYRRRPRDKRRGLIPMAAANGPIDNPGILLIGCGNMGRALLGGWLDQGIDAAGVKVIEPDTAQAEILGQNFGVAIHAGPEELPPAYRPDIMVFAVKPQVLDTAAPPYRRLAEAGAAVLSIIAGKPIAAFAGHLGDEAAIVRTMPNTPASVRRGITVACANRHVGEETRTLCHGLMEAIGEVAWVDDESLLDAVTAVSGSGPAYVFLLIECLAAAGEAAGLSAELAMRLARHTVIGAGELTRLTEEPAETLRRNVTSPGGTTEAALDVLMAQDGLGDLMRRAVAAAAKRSQELAG